MNALIDSCAAASALTRGQAARLLSMNKWKLEDSVVSFVDGGQFGFFVGPKPSGPLTPEIDCEVCMDTVAIKNTYSLGCGHRICRPCWAVYIETKIDQNLALHVGCFREECDLFVTLDDAEILLEPDSFSKFVKALFRSFVDHSDVLFWCKSPKGCSGIVTVNESANIVTCDQCSFTFCARCEYAAHSPASCDMMKDWDKRGGYQDLTADESETRRLKLEMTRPCPRCSTRIEKNGGAYVNASVYFSFLFFLSPF